jgi:hypothetical protein
MGTTAAAPSDTTTRATGFRAAQRLIARALETARVSDDPDARSLESLRLAPADPTRIARANPMEGDRIGRRSVTGAPVAEFAAFLDGIQVSRVLAHQDGIPIVHGTVAAVIRERVDRRLATWASRFEERLYAPRAFLPPQSDSALASSGLAVADTTPRRNGEPDEDGRHPLSLADVAVSAVQAHRETLELGLAESWVNERSEPLYIDGGISASSRVAESTSAVGVIKSHRTLYGDAAAVRLILSLAAGERTTVFEVASPNGWRSPVASWYLRLREGADPLWGLVRVEVSLTPGRAGDSAVGPSGAQALSARAEQISRWILAETSPLALPDGRWDTMAYGVRDCEQYLRSSIR